MPAGALGLLVEEERGEIAAAWRSAVDRELGGEPAIGFAVGPLLRELSLSLRDDAPPSSSAHARCAVLVRSGTKSSRLVREFALLHAAVWEILRVRGRIVAASERRVADSWLDEALAVAVERLDRQRHRSDLLDRQGTALPWLRDETAMTRVREGPSPVVARPPTRMQRPPPLPASRAVVPLTPTRP